MKSLVFFILLFISSNIFAMSPRCELIIIRNYSNRNVVVNREFSNGPGSNIDSDTAWHQTIFGITLSIKDMLAVIETNVVQPNESLQIITYYPLGPQLAVKYSRMYALPFIDKTRAIFKTLDIIYEDGETIITLDNLEEKVFEESEGVFILEIYEANSGRRVDFDIIADEEKRADLEYSDNLMQSIIDWSVAMSLPNGNIYIPNPIPGYSQEDWNALLMHQLHHQATYQEGNSGDVFEQLLKEATLYHFQGIDVYETENPPYWYLEYQAQQIQDNALRTLRTRSRTGNQ